MKALAGTQILFRVDASQAIGSGHMVRCQALADELALRGVESTFASRVMGNDPTSRPATRYALHAIEEPVADEVAAIRTRIEPGPARPFRAVVMDSYELGEEWLRSARALTSRRAVIDDTADRRLPCEIIVNVNPGVGPANYAPLARKSTRLLLGTRFAMVRGPFRTARSPLRPRDARVRRILISMGGTDRSGATALAVRAVTTAMPSANIDVVVGVRDAVEGLEGERVAVHHGVDALAMARLMTSADLAVGAGGTTSWERCALGLPSVIVRLASNQDLVAKELEAAGAAVDAGRLEDLTDPALALIVRRLSEDGPRLQAMGNRARDLVDGRGVERVAHHLEGVRIRRVTMADVDLLWRWANDPGTRAASFHPEPIPYAAHFEWLQEHLSAPSTELLIGWNGAGPLGQVRFEEVEGGAEISISTDPARRGTVGGLLLESAIRRYRRRFPRRDLMARVKVDNQQSRRLFERARFRVAQEARGVAVYRLRTATEPDHHRA